MLRELKSYDSFREGQGAVVEAFKGEMQPVLDQGKFEI